MRVLFTLTPGTGSLHPILPVAQALERAGHSVALCSAASFRPEADATGFPFFPAGLDYVFGNPDSMAARLAAAGLERPPLVGKALFEWMLVHINVGISSRRMAMDVVEVARDWGADLIIREGLEFGGCAAAEALGLPHASIEAPSISALDLRGLLAPAMAGLRAAVGLPEDPAVEMPYRYLNLCFTPPRFHGPEAVFPPTTHFLRHINPAWPGEQLPAWVADLPPRPTVLTSLGTIFYRRPGLNEAIIAGLRHEPINLVAAVGRDTDPVAFGPQPANVHIERYLPQTLLLPHCSLFVTHAGFNSVKESLSFGVPMVVLPIAGEQPYTAERCVALGVAQQVRLDERTPERVRAAVRAVLADPCYRASAVAMQRDMEALPGPEMAVELLERLAKEHRPLPPST